MIALSLRELAHALGGKVCGREVLAPAPGHSARDGSMSVRLSPAAPDGFIVTSHAGDSWQDCKDHVRARLGMGAWQPSKPRDPSGARRTPAPEKTAFDRRAASDTGNAAMALWAAGVNPRGTRAEIYLNRRRLDLTDDLAGDVLRWHHRSGAMLALFRDIRTGEPRAVARTFLDASAQKIERRFLGPVGGAAIMLDGFDTVTTGLTIGEGAETCMAARQLGLRPTWALGSAGAVANFPVLAGVECVTLLAEHDDASARAVETCAERWHVADREVLINRPISGKDLNDALRGAA